MQKTFFAVITAALCLFAGTDAVQIRTTMQASKSVTGIIRASMRPSSSETRGAGINTQVEYPEVEEKALAQDLAGDKGSDGNLQATDQQAFQQWAVAAGWDEDELRDEPRT
jgi:hypothetical protein